ncbi:hypothetical protein ACFPT0_12665, partial [Acinetobacter portensis]
GNNASAIADYATALGTNSNASGSNTVALGYSARALGTSAVAMGFGANASDSGAISIGRSARTVKDAVALGRSASATGVSSIAQGVLSVAVADDAIATGRSANASGIGAIALGANTISDLENSVAIGASSKTLQATATKSALTNSDVTATDPVVSFGSDTIKRRLQNIADGADANDAVNVKQLTAAQTNVASVIGTSAVVDANTGIMTATNIGGITGANTVDDAFKAVLGKSITFAGTTGTTTKKLDETLNIVGANSNITTEANTTDGLKIKLADNVDLTTAGSLKFGTTGTTVNNSGITFANGTALSNSGLVITNGPSLTASSLNMSSKKITNVAAGLVATDGVNLGQVLDLQTVVKPSVGGNAVVTGVIAADGQTTYTINTKNSFVKAATDSGIAVNSVYDSSTLNTEYTVDLTKELKDKIEAGSTGGALVNKGITFTGTTGTTTKKLDETLSIVGTNSNITTEAGTDGLKIALAKDLNLTANGSVIIGNATLNNSGLTISGGPSVTVAGINAGSKVIYRCC